MTVVPATATGPAVTETGPGDSQDPPQGLGIRVVRDLVRGLGGRIIATTASSEHGSRIVVTLPVSNRTGQEAAT